MATFRRLFLVATLAGLISGVFITMVHQVSTTQLILAAEVYETAAAAVPGVTTTHMHSDGTAHEHNLEAWAPVDGFERSLATALTDILTGIGFSLLLVAAYRIWGGRMNWRTGLYWGLAGFAAIVASPYLGLPPEVPGTVAAPLPDRQVWWLATVILTASGLALIFQGKHYWWAALGLALIVLPHVYGAPQPAEHASTAPQALAHRFIVATTIAGLLFWAVLGTATGYFYQRVFKDTDA